MKKTIITLILSLICFTSYTQDPLIIEVDSYIKRIAPTSQLDGSLLVSLCLKYDIDIAFVLAQGQLESHFGTKGTAKITNSVFNVGAYDYSSADQQINNGFGYIHPNYSIEPYLILLSNNYLINSSIEDLLNKYINIHGHRYASNHQYEVLLRSIYNNIKTTTNIYNYQYLL